MTEEFKIGPFSKEQYEHIKKVIDQYLKIKHPDVFVKSKPPIVKVCKNKYK